MAVRTASAVASMTRSSRRTTAAAPAGNAPSATTAAATAPAPATAPAGAPDNQTMYPLSRALGVAHTRNAQNILNNQGISIGSVHSRTKKRKLSSPDRDSRQLGPKRSRSKANLEIVLHSKSPSERQDALIIPKAPDAAPKASSNAANTASGRPAPHQLKRRRDRGHSDNANAAVSPPPRDASGTPSNGDVGQLTKHRAKVINGIRHELDRLQPVDENGNQQQQQQQQRGGRKLRSQEASRFKSELSAYFPDYDEVIGNDPKETHILTVDTPMVITDSLPRHYQGKVVAPLFTPDAAPQSSVSRLTTGSGNYHIRGYGDALFSDLCDSQRVNLDFLGKNHKFNTLEDPLSDDLYTPVHKKAERLERSIRNTEKGRAKHEKDQIIRLLEGLQGHDWLRTMGVSGVTESKKKTFEPAREHFIRGCEAILDKFRQWSQEEKRRKAERERVLAEEAEQQEELEEREQDEVSDAESEAGAEGSEKKGHKFVQGDDEAVIDDSEVEDEETDEGRGVGEIENSEQEDDSEPPDPDENDVDASIAKQLLEEATARSRIARASRKRSRSTASSPAPSLLPPPPTHASKTVHSLPVPPPKEFTSFFKKRHEREAALHKHRRAGRRVLAWGEPVPEMQEQEFELPEEYRDPDTMKAHARKRRRERRGSRH